jgi:hypothetical protein
MPDTIQQTSPPPGTFARTSVNDTDHPKSDGGFGAAAQWGLTSLLIGLTMLLMTAIGMVFNLALFEHGGRGFPIGLAIVGAFFAFIAGAFLNVAGLIFGIWGWNKSRTEHSTPAFALAGQMVNSIALIGWIASCLDLLAILFSFL